MKYRSKSLYSELYSLHNELEFTVQFHGATLNPAKNVLIKKRIE